MTSRIGKFTKAADSAPLPTGPPATSTTGYREFSSAEAEAAAVPNTIHDLQGQIAQLIVAFRESEERDPGPGDGEFWSAYKTLVERFLATYRPEGSGPNG